MILTKTRLATALFTILAASASLAEVVIISDNQPAANKPQLEQHVIPSGPKELNHIIDVNDLPFSYAIDSIKDSDWSVSYKDGADKVPVTWKGEHKSWVSLVKFISIDHDLSADIDHAAKRISITKSGNISAPEQSLKALTKNKYKKPQQVEQQVAIDVKNTADDVITCMGIGCTRPTISIEKLAIDNSWFSHETPEETVAPVAKKHDIKKLVHGVEDLADEPTTELDSTLDTAKFDSEEAAQDLAREMKHKERELEARKDFARSIIFHGKGTYEEFLNGGGRVEIGAANPETKYTYLLTKGSLFENVQRWAELNGYHVKNDIKDLLRKDYQIHSNVYLYGSFYDVTTNLLERYRNADYPVNHKFYKKGKMLHIFSDKYNITKY